MRRLEQLRPRQRSRLLGAGQELDLVARERLARVLSSEDFLPEHRAAPPLVDAMVGGALLVIVGLFVEPWKAVVLLVFVLVYQQVESSFFQPMVYSKAVQLNGLVILIALLVGDGY
jgi:hypothetical protein